MRRCLRDFFAAQGYSEKLPIGHFGTLDPGAQGVLPLAIGKATRLLPLIEDRRKCYSFTLVLGYATTSGDIDGEITESAPVPTDLEQRCPEVFARFLGLQQQTPPMTSALKHEGRRLYELAREGVSVERRARDITIDALEFLGLIEPPGLEPHLRAVRGRVHCSEGTYVRTLCEDIALALGTRGHMRDLLREAAGPFTLATALTLEQIAANPAAALLQPSSILPFPSLELTGEALVRFRHGQARLLKDGVLAEAGLDEKMLEAQTVFVTSRERDAIVVIGLGVLLGKQLVPRSLFA